MVRNAASEQLPVGSVAEPNVLSPPVHERLSSSHSADSSSHQQPYRADSSNFQLANGHLRIVGQDAQAKSLMQRVATGVATEAERAMFEQQVLRARSLPDIQQATGQHPPTISHPIPQPTRLNSDTGSNAPTLQEDDPARAGLTVLEYFQLQLRLLDERVRRRELMARSPMDPSRAGTSPSQGLSNDGGLGATFAANEDALRFPQATRENAEKYAQPFCDFLTNNPTVFHAVEAMKKQLNEEGFKELSERDEWSLEIGSKYYVDRNGSSLIAFVVGEKYKPGNGVSILAGHVDALTAKLKPVSKIPSKAGYQQLGIAPYGGAPNTTWWDRDLGIGGRVLVKEGDRIVQKLVKLDWPIARIPTLAPHFGAPAYGPFNLETQMVPIIGLEDTTASGAEPEPRDAFSQPPLLGHAVAEADSFVRTQPPALVRAVGGALGLSVDTYSQIVNWELELFDVQPARLGGLNKEFIYAGRIDDKLCSWAALQALIESSKSDTSHSGMIKMVGLFDDEEIGSLLRQGARGNLLPMAISRAVSALSGHHYTSDIMARTFANSFLVSSDVTHAVNPNFLGSYLPYHSPHLNVGVAVSADSNGHMTTDAVSTAILKRCADKVGAKLQVFQIRNDSRSGGTVGPMLSAMTGIRAIDAGIPQLSMHSIRATTGSLDPGLGVIMFIGFLNGFEEVDKEFR